MFYVYNGMFPGHWIAVIFMVFWWIIILMIVFAVLRWIRGSRHGYYHGMHHRYHSGPWNMHGGGESALDILEKRYARGEIDKNEYTEKRKDLAGE